MQGLSAGTYNAFEDIYKFSTKCKVSGQQLGEYFVQKHDYTGVFSFTNLSESAHELKNVGSCKKIQNKPRCSVSLHCD